MSYNSITGLGSHAGEANTWLRFQDNNATTQITDSSGNGNHATLQGGRTTADLSVAGDAWSTLAMKPDGVADYADFAAGTTAAFDGTEFTLVMRFKNPSSTTNFHFFGRPGTAQSAMYADNSGQRIRYRLGSSNIGASPTNRGFTVDTWDGHIGSWTDGSPIEWLLQDGQSGIGSTPDSRTFNPSLLWNRNGALSDIAIRELILVPRATTATEREALMAGPEPLYTGTAVGVTQGTRGCTATGSHTWDAQGNGTATTVYLWEVADDAIGTNTQPRSRSNQFWPSQDDAGKHVRLTVLGANPSGNVDDAESQVTSWVPLTAAAPSTQGKTAVVRGRLNNTGTTDFTVTGFGNVAGAIFIYMMSDGTTAVQRDSSIGFGFESWASNGAVNNAQYNTHARRDDAATSGDFAWRGQTLTYPIFLTVTGQAWNAAPIADGVQMTVATSGSDILECTVILFDENCHIETGDVEQSIAGQWDDLNFAFAPSIAFEANGNSAYTGTLASAHQNIGAFDNDGNAVQICTAMDRSNIPTLVSVQLTSGDWASQYTLGSQNWKAIPSWANNGFTMEFDPTSSSFGDKIPWFAVGNIGAKCGNYTGPNSVTPGVGPFPVAFSGPTTVTPETVLFINTLLAGPGGSTGTVAQTFGYGIDDMVDPHAYGVYQKRAASPATQVASTLDNGNSQTTWYDGGSAPLSLVNGALTSTAPNEMTVDYTVLGGNNYEVGYIAFGEASAAAGFKPFWDSEQNAQG